MIITKEIKVIPVDFFKEAGHKGGSTTVKKYGKRQMKKWAKLGGRPKKALDKPSQ